MLYLPEAFAQHKPDALVACMRHHPFATVIATFADGLEVAHLPLLVRRDQDAVILRGHVSRHNRLWQASELTAVFCGPHGYISAAWYQEGDTVPTWNYQVVHAQGPVRLLTDPGACLAFLNDLAQEFDRERAPEWQGRLTTEVRDQLLSGIVCFEIPVSSLEGKWKLSQTHSRARREKVIDQLRRQGGEGAVALAQAMADALSAEKG